MELFSAVHQRRHNIVHLIHESWSIWHVLFCRPEDSRTKFGTMSLNTSVPLRRMKETGTSTVLTFLALCIITSAVALVQKKGNRLKEKKKI